VAETTYAPAGWEHEPLRLIVRRVTHQADALSDDPRARRKKTIPREQLALGLAGEADTVYGYSFILTDLPGDAAAVERHHRERAQIEERIKDQKLGVSLRRLPLSDLDGNRFWLHCTALALNLLALLNDLMFGPEPPGHLPRRRRPSGCAECCSASPCAGHPPRPPDHPPAPGRTALRADLRAGLPRRARPRPARARLTATHSSSRPTRPGLPLPGFVRGTQSDR
jgi:DDE family transposase